MRCPRRTTSRSRGFPIGFAMAAATRLFWSAVLTQEAGYKCPIDSSLEHRRRAVPDHMPNPRIECSWAGSLPLLKSGGGPPLQ